MRLFFFLSQYIFINVTDRCQWKPNTFFLLSLIFFFFCIAVAVSMYETKKKVSQKYDCCKKKREIVTKYVVCSCIVALTRCDAGYECCLANSKTYKLHNQFGHMACGSSSM